MPTRSCESEENFDGCSIPWEEGVSPVSDRVVGIDPGLNVTGYAVVDAGPRGPVVVEAGVIRPGSADWSLGRRLDRLHRNISELLSAYPPGALAIEQVHSHVRFPRTSLLMAHARGVILLAAASRGIAVYGYAPTRVKKTLTGSGRAPKEQMQRAIQTELGLDELPEPHDVADACALAPCHYQVGRALRLVQDR